MKKLITSFFTKKTKPKNRPKAKPYPETFRTVQPKVHAEDYGEWLKYIYQELNRPSRRGL